MDIVVIRPTCVSVETIARITEKPTTFLGFAPKSRRKIFWVEGGNDSDIKKLRGEGIKARKFSEPQKNDQRPP